MPSAGNSKKPVEAAAHGAIHAVVVVSRSSGNERVCKRDAAYQETQLLHVAPKSRPERSSRREELARTSNVPVMRCNDRAGHPPVRPQYQERPRPMSPCSMQLPAMLRTGSLALALSLASLLGVGS